MDEVRLFCVPFAGGSALAFSKWKRLLGKGIQLHPIELAGRGTRLKIPLYNTLNEAVDDVYNMIKDHIDDKPYALFGHSMGCWIIYELYFKIKENNHQLPLHVFLSGRRAPDIRKKEKQFYKCSLQELKSEVLKLGGTPPEFFQDEELLNFFLPVLRSDFKITETYQYFERNEKLDCSVTVLSGKSDESITTNDLIAWKNHANSNFTIRKYNGGHFFIQDSMQEVITLFNTTLLGSNILI